MPWQDEVRRLMKTGDRKGKFKLEEGTNVFRVLPNTNATGDVDGSFENESPLIRTYSHRDVGPEKKWVPCGRNHAGEGSCYLCDVIIPALQKSGKRSKIALAKSIERRGQWVAQVAYMNESQRWAGPALWYVPGSGGDKSFCYKLMKKLQKKDYTNPVKGYNFTVEREGMGMKDTVYGDIEVDDAPTKVPSSIMKNLKPFSEMLPEYDKQQQVGAWKGLSAEEMAAEDDEDGDDETGDDDDETPKTPAKGKAKSAKKPVAEEEEEESADAEDEDLDVDAEDDEDEQPKKSAKGKAPAAKPKSGKSKPAPVEEDEPEEEDLDVDDDADDDVADDDDADVTTDEDDETVDDDDDLENLEDDEDEEPEPPKKGKTVPAKKPAPAPVKKAPKRR